jgi:hypothetical protein
LVSPIWCREVEIRDLSEAEAGQETLADRAVHPAARRAGKHHAADVQEVAEEDIV